MTPDDSDRRLREKIEMAFIPADLCTTNPDSIEALLDATKADPFPEDKIKRMLKKLNGELPLGTCKEEEEDPVWDEAALTEEEEALVALHRGGGSQLPVAIQEKLRRLRELAKRQLKEGDVCDD
jgi:hypothetical protein